MEAGERVLDTEENLRRRGRSERPAPAGGAHSLLNGNVALLGRVPSRRSLLPQSSCEVVAVGAAWRRDAESLSRPQTLGFPPTPGLPTHSPGSLSTPRASALPGGYSTPFLPSYLSHVASPRASFLSLPGGPGSQARNVQRPKVYFHLPLPQG